ncbi:MAG: tetratricopeptide repeat protein [Promethearchaeota archaeon]
MQESQDDKKAILLEKKALNLMKNLNYAAAAIIFDDLCKKYPCVAKFHFNKALNHYLMNDYALALKSLDEGLIYDKNDKKALKFRKTLLEKLEGLDDSSIVKKSNVILEGKSHVIQEGSRVPFGVQYFLSELLKLLENISTDAIGEIQEKLSGILNKYFLDEKKFLARYSSFLQKFHDFLNAGDKFKALKYLILALKHSMRETREELGLYTLVLIDNFLTQWKEGTLKVNSSNLENETRGGSSAGAAGIVFNLKGTNPVEEDDLLLVPDNNKMAVDAGISDGENKSGASSTPHILSLNHSIDLIQNNYDLKRLTDISKILSNEKSTLKGDDIFFLMKKGVDLKKKDHRVGDLINFHSHRELQIYKETIIQLVKKRLSRKFSKITLNELPVNVDDEQAVKSNEVITVEDLNREEPLVITSMEGNKDNALISDDEIILINTDNVPGFSLDMYIKVIDEPPYLTRFDLFLFSGVKNKSLMSETNDDTLVVENNVLDEALISDESSSFGNSGKEGVDIPVDLNKMVNEYAPEKFQVLSRFLLFIEEYSKKCNEISIIDDIWPGPWQIYSHDNFENYFFQKDVPLEDMTDDVVEKIVLDLMRMSIKKDAMSKLELSKIEKQVSYYKRVAMALYENAEYSRAIKIFNSLLKHDSRDIKVMFLLGFSYREIGKFKLAENLFKKIIELYYDNAYAWYCLAVIYALTSNGPKELYCLQKARDFGYDIDIARLSRLGLAYQSINPFE